MFPTTFENFDLLIIPAGDRYQARVINSPMGQATVDFVLPFDEQMLRSFAWLTGRVYRDIKVVEYPGKQENPSPALDAKSFGVRLYDAVFAGEVGGLLVRCRDQANAAGKGLRIRLRLDSGAPELAELPWEYLFVSEWANFPALSAQTPIVRYIELAQAERALSVKLPLRILAVVSNPKDFPQLQVEQEWERLQSAVAEIKPAGSVVLERLGVPTLAALQDHLRAADVHILHFIGHGHFDLERNEGSLIFEDESGAPQLVPAEKVATLILDEKLHMVFLNACDGARSGPNDSFAGVATKLVQQGVPAVLAMQFPVSDKAALILAHEFYKALADNYPVDAAVAEARKKLYVGDQGMEWGTPVLYMRSADGHIFDIQQKVEQGAKPAEDAAEPAWHRRGILWLAAGLLGIALLVGLGSLLLTDRPTIRITITVIFGAIASLLSYLGLSSNQTVGQRLTHSVARSRPLQGAMAATLLVSLALWIAIGLPYLRAEECGPLGCAPEGTKRFAIGEWENLTPDKPLALVWTEGTRSVLYDKLSRIDGLQAIALDSPQVAEKESRRLDLWITGEYQEIEAVQLTAEVVGRGGRHLQTVRVRQSPGDPAGGIEASVLALQDEMAQEILAALAISVTAEVAEAIHNTPTSSPEALRLNNEAALLIAEGDLQGAETLLQEAIALDPAYASPHNNLGRIFSLRGDLPAALLEYRRAARLLPRNPIYPFNAAAVLERMGDYAAAVQSYARAIRLDPAYIKAYNNLGFTHLQLGNLDAAQESLQTGISLAPEYPYLHKNLGRVLLEQGNAEEAVQELQQAIELSTEAELGLARDLLQAETLYFLALAYQALEQTEAACTTLTRDQGLATQNRGEWAEDARNLLQELQCE
jgi:tetratricopeptide (TPR) repeat protein